MLCRLYQFRQWQYDRSYEMWALRCIPTFVNKTWPVTYCSVFTLQSAADKYADDVCRFLCILICCEVLTGCGAWIKLRNKLFCKTFSTSFAFWNLPITFQLYKGSLHFWTHFALCGLKKYFPFSDSRNVGVTYTQII